MKKQNEQIKNKIKNILSINEKLHIMADKYFSITKWITNVSIALLGFFIALLLQLKFNGDDILSIFSVGVFSGLTISVLLGLSLNLIYNVFDLLHQKREIEQYFALDMEDKIFQADESLWLTRTEKFKMLSHYWIVPYVIIFPLSVFSLLIYLIGILFI